MKNTMSDVFHWTFFLCLWFLCDVTSVVGLCPIGCRCSRGIQADCSNLGLTQIPDDLDPRTEFLDLSHNNIRTLSTDAFASTKLTNVTILLLDNNELEEILPYAFRGLHKLQLVNLQANRISVLRAHALSGFSGSPQGCLAVEECRIDLRYNPLSVVEANALAWMKRLGVYIGESEVALKIEAYAFYGIKSVPKLAVHNIPHFHLEGKAFTNAEGLTEFEIYNTRLSCIKQFTFQGLKEVKLINISSCEIPRLEPFGFSGISYFSKERDNSSNVRSDGHFIMDSCVIDGIPNQLFRDTNPLSITLSNNQINRVEGYAFEGILSLRQLTLLNNSINKLLHYSLASLHNMHEIALIGNNLSVIQNGTFEGTQYIDRLTIGHNPSVELTLEGHAFTKLSDIRHFSIADLSSLSIKSRAFHNMHSVELFEIKNSRLPLIPARAFSGLRKVRVMRIQDCDVSIIEPGAFGNDFGSGTVEVLDLSQGNSFPCDCETSKRVQEFSLLFSSFKLNCTGRHRDFSTCAGQGVHSDHYWPVLLSFLLGISLCNQYIFHLFTFF